MNINQCKAQGGSWKQDKCYFPKRNSYSQNGALSYNPLTMWLSYVGLVLGGFIAYLGAYEWHWLGECMKESCTLQWGLIAFPIGLIGGFMIGWLAHIIWRSTRLNEFHISKTLIPVTVIVLLACSVAAYALIKEDETGGNSIIMHLYDANQHRISLDLANKAGFSSENGVDIMAMVGDTPGVEYLNFEGKLVNDGARDYCAIQVWVWTADPWMKPVKQAILDSISPYSIPPFWDDPNKYCSKQTLDYGTGWDLYTINGLKKGEEFIFETGMINIDQGILKGANQIDSPFKFRVTGYYGDCCGTFDGPQPGMCSVKFKEECSDKSDYTLDKRLKISEDQASLSIEFGWDTE